LEFDDLANLELFTVMV